MRAPRTLAREARLRAQRARMNEMAKVVKRELQDADRGAHYGDTSGGYEIAPTWWNEEARLSRARPVIGFRA